MKWWPICLLVFVTACSAPPTLAERYTQLLGMFDAERPGYGLDAYTPDEAMDQAMAYALFASAEANRGALESAKRAAGWLIANRPGGGWGLPFAWDAFSDGSENPANTVYTITTALGVQGLLDVYDATGEAVYRDTAKEAMDTLLGAMTDDYFWYSVRPEDDYPVYNVNGMMLGQLQRLGMSDLADEVLAFVLSGALRDEAGHVYWPYSADNARPNDLVHESYTMQGLVDYVRFGGRREVDLLALYDSLERFIGPKGVRELPGGEARARLWGIGAALSTAVLLERELGLEPDLSRRFAEAAFEHYDLDEEPFYPRQAAHVLQGLSLVAFPPRHPVGPAGVAQNSSRAEGPALTLRPGRYRSRSR